MLLCHTVKLQPAGEHKHQNAAHEQDHDNNNIYYDRGSTGVCLCVVVVVDVTQSYMTWPIQNKSNDGSTCIDSRLRDIYQRRT